MALTVPLWTSDSFEGHTWRLGHNSYKEMLFFSSVLFCFPVFCQPSQWCSRGCLQKFPVCPEPLVSGALSRARSLHMMLCSSRNRNNVGLYCIKNALVCHAKHFTALWSAHGLSCLSHLNVYIIWTLSRNKCMFTLPLCLYHCKIRLYVYNRTVFIAHYKSHCNYLMHPH